MAVPTFMTFTTWMTAPRTFTPGVVLDGLTIMRGFSDDVGMDELWWRIPPRQVAECYAPVVTGIIGFGFEFDTGQGQTMVGFSIQQQHRVAVDSCNCLQTRLGMTTAFRTMGKYCGFC